jgi:hypothetical protein
MLGQFAAAMASIGPYSHLTVEEHRDAFLRAGYSDAQVWEDWEKGWVCASGKNPEVRPAPTRGA